MKIPTLIFGLLCLSPVLSSSNDVRPSHGSSARFSTWPQAPWVCPASVFHLRAAYSTAAQSPFSYRISASYSAKGQRLNPERNVFHHDPFVRVRRSADGRTDKRNRPQSGQDSFFVSQVGTGNSVAMGVVDGVGGWQDQGIDPADFAHGLCEYMAGAAKGHPAEFPEGPLHPRDLLQYGYRKVLQDRSIRAGGSTACIATADPLGHMEIANLGDSGFIHFGLNAVRYVSDPQTHAFNTPFQLSKVPLRERQQMELFGASAPLGDLPKDAAVTHHRMQHGDIMVFASDGVWDNLSPQDMLRIVSRYMIELGGWIDAPDGVQISPQLQMLTERGGIDSTGNNALQSILALAVTREAKEASVNMKRDGPFAKEVQRYYPGENWRGGKVDDICVVVVIALEGAD